MQQDPSERGSSSCSQHVAAAMSIRRKARSIEAPLTMATRLRHDDGVGAHGPRFNLSHVDVAQRKHAHRLEQLARALLGRRGNNLSGNNSANNPHAASLKANSTASRPLQAAVKRTVCQEQPLRTANRHPDHITSCRLNTMLVLKRWPPAASSEVTSGSRLSTTKRVMLSLMSCSTQRAQQAQHERCGGQCGSAPLGAGAGGIGMRLKREAQPSMPWANLSRARLKCIGNLESNPTWIPSSRISSPYSSAARRDATAPTPLQCAGSGGQGEGRLFRTYVLSLASNFAE